MGCAVSWEVGAGFRGSLGAGSVWAGGWLWHGVSPQAVPRLQCHCRSKPGDPQMRYLPRSWQTCFLKNSRTLLLQDLEVGERIVLGLTGTKWLHGEVSKLGNLNWRMRPCWLPLSARVFLCLGYKTGRMALGWCHMVAMGEGAWPSEMAGQACHCHGWLMLHVAPACACTGEALRACDMLSSCPVTLWPMLWPVEICL